MSDGSQTDYLSSQELCPQNAEGACGDNDAKHSLLSFEYCINFDQGSCADDAPIGWSM